MENAGLYNHSFRALADKAGIGTTTVTGLVYGRRQSDEKTLQAVADALRLPVPTIRKWASQALGLEAPFELPPEANQLNPRQRQAILTVVRVMLDPLGQESPTLEELGGLRMTEDPAADVEAPVRNGRDT